MSLEERPRPMLDLTFKALFGKKAHETWLLSLLNAMLEHPGFAPIVEVTFLNVELEVETVNEKHPAVDVRVRDKDGRQFNIEVQLAEQQTWPQRMLYYWSKMYAHQLIRGQIYDKLNPVICVAFLGFELDARKGYMRRIVPWDQTHQVVFSEHLELYLFEMPKFSLMEESGIPNKREQWLHFLKEGHIMQLETAEAWQTPEILEALEELKKLAANRKWRDIYDAREKALRDYISTVHESFEKGREEGREKGREEGREEGLQAAAMRLFKRGMAPEQVAELLEFPLVKAMEFAAKYAQAASVSQDQTLESTVQVASISQDQTGESTEEHDK